MKASLLLVSGWAHTAEELQPLADRLGRHHPVRMLAIHELGTDADRSNVSGLYDYAAGLCLELEQEKSPCFLAGWSMGGMIALETVARRQDRVAGLVLISSAPRLADGPDFPEGVPVRILKAMHARLQKAPEKTLDAFFRDAAFPGHLDDRARKARVSTALGIGADRLAGQLRYLMETDLRSTASRIALPTLVLHGRLDRIMPLAAASWLAENLPRAKKVTWDDAGHSVPLQHPDRVAARIRLFLEDFS